MWNRKLTFLPQLIYSISERNIYWWWWGKKRMIWLQMYRFAFPFNSQTYVRCYLIVEAGSLFSDNFQRNTCLQWNQSLISFTNKYISCKHSRPPTPRGYSPSCLTYSVSSNISTGHYFLPQRCEGSKRSHFELSSAAAWLMSLSSLSPNASVLCLLAGIVLLTPRQI